MQGGESKGESPKVKKKKSKIKRKKDNELEGVWVRGLDKNMHPLHTPRYHIYTGLRLRKKLRNRHNNNKHLNLDLPNIKYPIP